ncbi:MAG: parallel beta-helix domain-containing protein [Gammaproteobacteria bacterium]|nr:parallel beta-helix domain-containing protein [Gammaproteobacteria bacterium]
MRILFIITLLFSFDALTDVIIVPPSDEAQERIQEALILANPGDEVHLTTGIYSIEDGLSLDIDNIILSGEGHENTILDFSNQMTGAQGLLVTSNKVLLKDFAITNTKGDAIKAIGSDGIYFINIRTEWTSGPKSTNGAYGLYPVQSKDVLIDGCVAIGASDAGIYVGQSQNIIVRNSRAEYNVAGIEIENSYYADVHSNIAQHNTGGILVFDLPDLPQQGGHHVRVFSNQILNNDTDNFAPEGNIVGEVPRGTGVIVMANSDVEIFDNDISGNETMNIAIVSYSYEEAIDETDYYPHPRAIQIHNNRLSNSGYNPDMDKEIASVVKHLAKEDMPDIFWDGVLPLSQMIFGQPEQDKLILKDNYDSSFMSIKPIQYMLSLPNPVNRDSLDFKGTIEPLNTVIIDLPSGYND